MKLSMFWMSNTLSKDAIKKKVNLHEKLDENDLQRLILILERLYAQRWNTICCSKNIQKTEQSQGKNESTS